MKEIQLTQGKVALVDDEDFEELNRFKWTAFKARKKYYVIRRDGEGKGFLIHREILKITDAKIEVDHIDGNTLNNTRANLRPVNKSQNMCNRTGVASHNTSGFRGVVYDKVNKNWISKLGFRGKSIHMGRFDTPEEAAKAFDKKAKELFGEFCGKLNFE